MAKAEELVRKKRLRAGHRASTMRILGQDQPAITAKPLNVSKINQLKRSLEDKLHTLSVLDEEILGLMEGEAIEEEIVQADEIKECIYAAQSRLDYASLPVRPSTMDPPTADWPPTVAPPARDPPTNDPSARDPPAEDPSPTPDPPATRCTRKARVKLPKISLL